MTRDDLHERTGMVHQDLWLVGGTIHDNIAYGDPTATRAEVIEAADLSHVDHFVRTLPGGYDTVLDAATSSVDIRTELLIRQAMVNPAHRPPELSALQQSVRGPVGRGTRPLIFLFYTRIERRPEGR